VTTHVFLDTSVLMEFRRPDEIPWRDLVGGDDVVLVVAPKVQNEIDNHKRSDSRRKRKRAEGLVRWFREIKGRPSIAVGVSLQFLTVEPRAFDAHDLDPNVADDRLLASVLAYPASGGEAAARIATGDFGMELKAGARRVLVIVVPDDYRLEPEEDAEVVELRRERDELRRRAGRVPELLVSFPDELAHLKIVLAPAPQLAPLEVDMILDQERTKLTEFREVVATVRGSHEAYATEASADDSSRVAKQLGDLRAHLEAASERRQVESRSFQVVLMLANKGTAPAKNIDVYFKLPEWVHLREEPIFPEVPERPKVDDWLTQSMFAIGLRTHAFPAIAPIVALQLDGFFAEDAPRWHILRLRHGEVEEMKLWLQLDPDHEVESFAISLEIHSDDLIKPATVKLHFVIALEPYTESGGPSPSTSEAADDGTEES